MTNSQTKDNIEVPNHTDKIDDLLRCVRDAGATDDNFGGEDWTLSDKVIDEAKAQLRNYISEEIKAVIGSKHYIDEQCVKDDLYGKAQLSWLRCENKLMDAQLTEARNRGHNV